MSPSSPREDPILCRRICKLEARRINLRYWIAVSDDEITRAQYRALLVA